MLNVGLVNVDGTIFGGNFALFRNDVRFETKIILNYPSEADRELLLDPIPGAERPGLEEEAPHRGPEPGTDRKAPETLESLPEVGPVETEDAEIERAPCTIETILVFDDPAIRDRNQFDQIDIGNVRLVLLRGRPRDVTVNKQPRFKVTHDENGLSVSDENEWRLLDKPASVSPIREYPKGFETSLPETSEVAHFFRGTDRLLTLYICPLDRELVLGGQRCRFSSDVIDHLYLAAIRKRDKKGTLLHGIALLAVPKSREEP